MNTTANAPAMTLEIATLLTVGFTAKFGSPRYLACAKTLESFGLEPTRLPGKVPSYAPAMVHGATLARESIDAAEKFLSDLGY